MKRSKIIISLLIGIFLFNNTAAKAQKKEKINWINFNQLSDSLTVKPKKVFVSFYADWCTFCKEMEESTFLNKNVIETLNNDYYAVKMNIETRDTIVFGGQTFVNKRYKKVNPIHEIALLMGSRKNKPFSLPAFILLDEKFIAKSRYFPFLDSNTLISILSK